MRSGRSTFGTAYDRRCNNFDFLRFVLATLVLVSHCFSLGGRVPEPLAALSREHISGGRIAVDGFFVLSGFMVTQSWRSTPGLAAFAWKRFLRLIPALVVTVTFAAFVVGPFVTAGPARAYLDSGTPWQHFASVILHKYVRTPGVFPYNPFPHYLNGSLWTLRYEMLCYATVGLLSFRREVWRPAIAVVFVGSWLGSFVPGDPLAARVVAIRLMACFAAGAFSYAFQDAVPYHAGLAAVAAVALAAAFVGGGYTAIFPIAGAYLLLCAGFAKRLGLMGFGRYGDFSYGLYLFAFPVQQAVIHVLGRAFPFLASLGLTFVITLALAMASWHLVEAPALALKQRGPGAAGRRLAA
jgi:peptidoglycan/LPS O-acetylase OafA/YrhL